MSAVLNPEGEASPALSILQLDMRVNATDSQLRANLRHSKSLRLPELQQQLAHDRVLAIVGSGPSLINTWRLIPPDCDVMALNGAYGFLNGNGRVAEYFAMLDSRDVNRPFVASPNKKTTFLIASQCHADVFESLNGMRTEIFHLHTPTTKAEFSDSEMYVGGGGTIGLTALALALALGYRKVILYGYDSSFAGDATHAVPQAQNSGQSEIDIWLQDRKYRTTHAMAAQVMDFFSFYEAIRKVAPDFSIHLIGDGLFYDYVVTNNNESTRERELAKYLEVYKHDDYGMTQERRDGIGELLSGLSGESYLDVSTGRGEALELAKARGFSTIQGTETVPYLCNENITNAILPSLPFADQSFDVVSLIEVIEHLLPSDVEPSLRELTRIARNHILISAAVSAHWYGGVNLHPSAMPEEEWQTLFSRVWGDKVKRVRNLGQSPCWRVDL